MTRAFGWHRSRRAGIALPLLLALLFRAVIPAGFMPALDAHGYLTLALCPALVAPVQQGSAPAAHNHHDHAGESGVTRQSGDHDHHPGAEQDHTLCLFAASAGGAPLAITFDQPVIPTDRSVASIRERPTFFAPTIVRAQSSRAPPISASV